MKRIFKSFITLSIVLVLCFSLIGTAFAANPTVEELQSSVVFIESTCSYTSSNTKFVVTSSGTGTGFAVGIPGEPVQYIGTCNHVVSVPSGVYTLYIDKNGNMVKFVEEVEGKQYPVYWEGEDGSLVITDYFTGKLESAVAIFSAATGDYTSLSVIESNEKTDVAICKLASEPTTKIKARPFVKHEDVSVGDPVYAIGYPGVSKYFNDEGKYDYTDSTVTKGIISKSQLTYGIFNSDKQFYSYQIDASIAQGNSGGPLFLEDGSIAGINAFGYKNGTDKADYAIAIDELIKILDTASVPYALASDTPVEEPAEEPNNMLPIIIAVIAGVLIVIAIVAIVIIAKKNKSKNDAAKVVSDAPAANIDATAAAPVAPKASSNGRYYLIGVSGKFEGKKYAIDERVVFGRDSARCNVAYPENQPGVSAVHCELIRSGSVLTLKDCNSTYGTFLKDGTKLTPNVPVVLNSGDTFYVGDKSNVFEVKY